VALPDAGEIVFPGGDGCLYGFDAKSGQQHWTSDFNALGGTKGLYFETQPLVAGGAVIASLRLCVERGPQKGAPLIAITPGANPKVKWIFGRELNGFWGQMLLQDGVVYACSAPNILHALDPATGAERWRLALGGDVGGVGLQLGGGNGKIYVSNEDGDLFVVRVGDKPELLATFNLREMPAEYGRPTLCEHGLCVLTHEGVLMLRLP
jgi:outer membrane protein assembly factor BamB